MRYGIYLGAIQRHRREISFSAVLEAERAGPRRPRLRVVDVHRLLTPYVSFRFAEQLRAVLPLALMLIGFQALALRTSLLDTESVALGIFSVIAGLMVFTEGVKYGLMPFAENVGFQMPGRTHPAVLLFFSLLLGAAATFAEPAIGALQAAASAVSPERSPWLRQLLGPYVLWLVLAVAGGVGLAVAVGMLRMMFGWPLKKMVLLIVPPALALTAWCAQQPDLAPIIGLAWDCGAITTGPVTVPLVLAVGVGVAASTGRSDNPLSGFGIVTLASLFPVLAVLCVAIYLTGQGAGAMLPVLPPSLAGWEKETPYAETIGALRAIVPLVLLLVLVQTLLLRQKIRQLNVFIYGISTALAGMVLFNLGLTAGLVALGEQAGTNVPWAFSTHRVTGAPALYPFVLGIAMTMVFAFAIGYGATVAEPALNAMGMTVENLTNGVFRKRMLIHAVAVGVGCGAALGVARILFDLPLWGLLLTGYTIALVLTIVSREEIVNLAWDSAGVTTGPVTVPLLLALGIGLGDAVNAADGFGILALCSVGPIISVLATGLWADLQSRSATATESRKSAKTDKKGRKA
ncbi:MAG TPA: DUF1538 domain-containing protein [Candidatus Accumulibacter phosphatis]|nr:DUF1538 domain-containing protein [Accumulibacter sp.]HCN69674.1 DUF1538 domain-containing protein [Accumulibacter sp.]HCV13991.1 DUF1538 domain-containing protein [Accumulibacter sp.]HRL75372.1 DUF1538 domain-containing protein [Candidatus Accumulibacter phosphatis]HRQ95919.1 DUF1538 domain-containing protein [Candidatus Accumulibacter phosphatis]